MSYTHTSAAVPCEAQTFCADCDNPIPRGELARRRVTDTDAPAFKVEWLCAGACGPIIDVSDDTLMRKRIAALEEQLAAAKHDRTMALELAQQSQDEATQLAEVLTTAERECDRLREQLDAARGAQAEVETDMSPIEVHYPRVASKDWITVSLTHNKRVQVMVSEGGPNDAYRHSRTIQMPTDLARRLIYQLDQSIRAIEGAGECAEPLCSAEIEAQFAEALERELTHDEYDCNDLECTRHGWRAQE